MRPKGGEDIFMGGLLLFGFAAAVIGMKAVVVLITHYGVIGTVVLAAILGIVLMIYGLALDMRSVP